jgi:cobalt-zinc-cadmium efflux system outer membrane protein
MATTRNGSWPGKQQLDQALSLTTLALAEARYQQAWQDEALVWAELWVSWQRAGALADIAESRTGDARERLEAERQRLAQERGRAVDIDRLQRTLSLAEMALEQAHEEAEIARLMLESRFPGTAGQIDSADTLLAACDGADIVTDPDTAYLQSSPRVRVARLESESADLQRRRAERDRRADPRLGLQVFSERSGAETGVGVSVSMPITGGLRTARVDEALGQQQGRAAALYIAEAEARRIYLQGQVRQARSARRLEQAHAAVASAERVLERLDRGRDLQAVTALDFLEARAALWSAREAEARARAELHEASLVRNVRMGCVLQPDH